MQPNLHLHAQHRDRCMSTQGMHSDGSDTTRSGDLVVSEGHGAAQALLQAHVLHVSEETVPLTTGLGHRLPGADEPEETLLKVLWAADATAVKLQHRIREGNTEMLFRILCLEKDEMLRCE